MHELQILFYPMIIRSCNFKLTIKKRKIDFESFAQSHRYMKRYYKEIIS